MRVIVLGLGYVGSTMAACLAKCGHKVIGIDSNAEKLAAVAAGVPPIREPGLEDLFAAALEEDGLLTTAQAVDDHCLDADVALVCVGTPSRPDGLLDMSHVVTVAEQLGAAVRRRPPDREPLLCVFRSTMLPGTIDAAVIPTMTAAAGEGPGTRYEVAFNPEFLRESAAISDYFRPPKIVIGERFPGASKRLLGLYNGIDAPVFEVSFKVAEMVKMVDNAFHALKVSFANEVGRLASSAGIIEVDDLMDVFVADRKLNISPAYLRPGGPFGGSCLPKDVSALCALAARNGVEMPVIGHVLASNAVQQGFLTERVVAAAPERCGILLIGLTFKAGTDDLRESPMVHLARDLLDRGYRLEVFDPDLDRSEVIGENLRFALRRLPELFSLLVDDLEGALGRHDVIVRAKSIPLPEDPPAGAKVVDVNRI